MKKWVVIVFLSCLALGAVCYWGYPKLMEARKKSSGAGAMARPTTAMAETRDIHFTVSAAGDIGPAEQVSVRPEVSGRIETLPVDIGDSVRKGAILFTLNDQDLQIELSQRQIEIEGAKLQLEKARRNFERSEQLFQEKLISQELYEDTRTDFELAKNSRDRAEKNLKLVEDHLSKTRIMAPFDCTVLTRPVSIGQAVSGASGFNSGTEVLSIADLNDMIVNAHVNQADVTRLVPGQEVNIQIDSVAGLRMKGRVERIAPQSTIKNSIKGYSARVLLKHVDPRVRPGMTANLSIPVASAQDVVAVPLAAVFTEQGERFVYLKTGATYQKRLVQIGLADYEMAEVQSGLSSGDIVALVPPPGELLAKAAQSGPASAGSEAGKSPRPAAGSNAPTLAPGGAAGGRSSGAGGGASSAR